jgi:hypothetical protein
MDLLSMFSPVCSSRLAGGGPEPGGVCHDVAVNGSRYAAGIGGAKLALH